MSEVASPVSVAPITAPLSYADDAAPVPPVRRAEGGPSLRSRTIKGTIWTTGGYGASQVLRLGVNLVLTRLLQPQMFGLMSLVNIFIQGLQGFSDVGIGPAIIQSKRGDDPAFLNTAWTIQVLRGMGLGAMSAVIAWPIARLYGQHQLIWLLPAAGLGAVIAGFNSTALFTLNRHMEVGKLTLRGLVGQVAGAGVMVAWALVHPTVWALLAGNIAAAVANLAFSYTLVPGQRNRFLWDKSSAQEMMKFGRWIFISTILTFLALQADRLIFGKLITLHDLGIYSVAAMMAALPTTAILKLGGVVVFPAYSRARASGANFQKVFDQVRLPLLAGAGLIAAGMVGGGRQVIELLYDPRYHGAGTMLQLLAVAGWFQVMQVTNGSALLALGSPRSVAAANVVKLLAIVIFVPVGFLSHGLLGGIAGIIVADALKYCASALLARRKGLHMLGKDLGLSLLVAVTGVAAALLAEWVRHRIAGPRVGGVVALLVVGLIVGTVWGPVIVGSLRARKVVS